MKKFRCSILAVLFLLGINISALSFTAEEDPDLQRLFNLALNESRQNMEQTGLFFSGKIWYQVHTRDSAIAVYQSLGLLFPEASVKTLQSRVADDIVLQDSETGGGWPVAVDRVWWIPAALTGCSHLYSRAEILKNIRISQTILERSYLVSFDKKYGLFKGESTYLNWREETYPLWIEPRLIAESFSSSNNLLHLKAVESLISAMQTNNFKKREIAFWKNRAFALASAIKKHLYIEEKGYYSAYSIPEAHLNTDMTDNFANILASSSGYMNQQNLIYSIPVSAQGIPSVYPQLLRNKKPQHNKGFIPFVAGYYIEACRKAGYYEGIDFAYKSLESIGLKYGTFPTAVDLVSGSRTTALNSDRQLWSDGAYLAAVLRGFFGLELTGDSLSVAGYLPEFIKGPIKISGLNLGTGTADILLQRSDAAGIFINGIKISSKPAASIQIEPGHSSIVINVSKQVPRSGKPLRFVSAKKTLPPLLEGFRVTENGNSNYIEWNASLYADEYQVLRNGDLIYHGKNLSFMDTPADDSLRYDYIVRSLDSSGWHSLPTKASSVFKEFKVYSSGDVFATNGSRLFGRLKLKPGKFAEFEIEIDKVGNRSIDFYYNNVTFGSSGCVIRKVDIDGIFAGFAIFPKTSLGKYNISTRLNVFMEAGSHKVKIYHDDDCVIPGNPDSGFILKRMNIF